MDITEDVEYSVPKKELAEMLNVSERTVERLVQRAVLVPIGGARQGVRQMFNVRESISSFIAYMGQRHKNREPTEAELDNAYWDLVYMQAKATTADIEAQELRGELHREEDLSYFLQEMVYSLRGMMLALPGRLAVEVTNANTTAEKEALIRHEVDIILEELDRHKYDPQKYEERVRERRKWESLRSAGPEATDE